MNTLQQKYNSINLQVVKSWKPEVYELISQTPKATNNFTTNIDEYEPLIDRYVKVFETLLPKALEKKQANKAVSKPERKTITNATGTKEVQIVPNGDGFIAQYIQNIRTGVNNEIDSQVLQTKTFYDFGKAEKWANSILKTEKPKPTSEPEKESSNNFPKVSNFREVVETEKGDKNLFLQKSYAQKLIALNGKRKNRKSIENLLKALQKDIVSRKLRKTDIHADFIVAMQNYLINILDEMETHKIIEVRKKLLQQAAEMTNDKNIAIDLLNKFVNFQSSPTESKAQNYLKAVEREVKKGAITDNHPLIEELHAASQAVKHFINTGELKIKEQALNGILKTCTCTVHNGSSELRIKNVKKKSKSVNGLGSLTSSDDLMKTNFEIIQLTGDYGKLLGNPERNFKMAISAAPGAGKSTWSLGFARYLAASFHPTLYVSTEEGSSLTMQDKIRRVGGSHPRLFLADKLPKEIPAEIQTVFIDSVNHAGMDIDDLRALKAKYPDKSMVFILQQTKAGQFRGSNEIPHEVDITAKIENGTISTEKNRFNQLTSTKVNYGN